MNNKRQPLGKAQLCETVTAECPKCGQVYIDTDPGWREKPQDDGISFSSILCSKCKTYYFLDFNLK